MSKTFQTPVASPRPWDSLRLRLPLLFSVVVVAIVGTCLWLAFREVEAILLRAGRERATAAAEQVAGLLERAMQQGTDNLRQTAARRELREFLRDPTPATRQSAVGHLSAMATPGPRRIELWSDDGGRLLEVSTPDPFDRSGLPETLPSAERPSAAGVGPLHVVNNLVFSDLVAQIDSDPSVDTTATRRLGYILVRSTFAVSPPGVLGRSIGSDAVIGIGNRTGGPWTDLSKAISPPPADLTRQSATEYRAASGEMRVGAISTIPGTPWGAWVEFPRSIIVAPAGVFLRRMIGVATVVVLIGALLVLGLTGRITKPLGELAQAAQGIAAGDYSRRVAASRRDEMGQLGHAFNAMVTDMQHAQQEMETRVRERSQALDALRESEAHYRAIVEVALDCIITIDEAGRVVEFNPAAETTFGYKKQDALGKELADLIIPPEHREAHRRALARYIATGQSSLIGRLIEMPAMRSDGTQFPVELAISAVASDGPNRLTGVVRNITERKRVEAQRLKLEAIEAQNRRMQEANRLKSEFVANMSHELRTPLNAIIGFADLMHKGKVGPVSAEHEEYLGDILTSSRHLLQLINDVLDLAKVESGNMEFRPEPVDLAQLTSEVRDILRGLAADKRLRLEITVDRSLSPVTIDPARVKQILYNYLSNAIKFTPDGGSVTVRVVPEGAAFFRIAVDDTGVGVAPENLDRLFVEFQQLDGSIGKRHQGTGLGLALTKRLAAAQGGSVGVRSSVGVGSTFSVVLPRVAPPASPEGVSSTPVKVPVILADTQRTPDDASVRSSRPSQRASCTAVEDPPDDTT